MEDETNYIDAVKRMLNEATNAHKLTTQQEALEFLGENFRLLNICAPWKSNVYAGQTFLRKFCMIHMHDTIDKVIKVTIND